MNAIKVEGLYKTYDNFTLKNINFEIKPGEIIGLIGENGAGKSTILRQMLNIGKREKGSIYYFDEDLYEDEKAIKEDIGIVFDECVLPNMFTAADVDYFMKDIYKRWSSETFYKYLSKLNIPRRMEIQKFSKGMKMKISIAVALSHKARILMLDEATSGLDPVIRDEILDALVEFVEDKEHAILFSTHIISDIEKAANRILLIHKGEPLFFEEKEEIFKNWGVFEVGQDYFDCLYSKDIEAYQMKNEKYIVLTKNIHMVQEKYKFIKTEELSLEKIMLIYIKGKWV